MLEALDIEVELMEDGARAVEACRGLTCSAIQMDLRMQVMSGIARHRARYAPGGRARV